MISEQHIAALNAPTRRDYFVPVHPTGGGRVDAYAVPIVPHHDVRWLWRQGDAFELAMTAEAELPEGTVLRPTQGGWGYEGHVRVVRRGHAAEAIDTLDLHAVEAVRMLRNARGGVVPVGHWSFVPDHHGRPAIRWLRPPYEGAVFTVVVVRGCAVRVRRVTFTRQAAEGEVAYPVLHRVEVLPA